MTLKVVGAGFGRTGTLSLKGALESLGVGRCYHMVEVLANPGFDRYWMQAAARENVDWDAAFAGYGACVDWPACSFYKEIAAHFQHAKVILTERDADAWYDSCARTIFPLLQMDASNAPPQMRDHARMVKTVIAEGVFDNRLNDRDHCIAVYKAHNDEVRRTIPAARLLVYSPGDGWEPLCRFLGVAVPSVPFPKVNTTEEFLQRFAKPA